LYDNWKTRFGVAALAATLCSGVIAAAVSEPAAQSDLDALMQHVLAKRDENWKKLQQYILDERESVAIRGPAGVPVWGEHRDFTWYIRDGYFIKSPVKVNGVVVSEADRVKEEESYLRRVKARDKRDAEAPRPPDAAPERQEPEPLARDISLLRQSRQPEFIDSAYFLRFKFEQGTYALVGRETFEGQDVLRIEYYPARLFSHEQDKQEKARQTAEQKGEQRSAGQQRDDALEATIERLMNKVSLVTLWVEPKSAQIVKYTFDNVNFDFLPAAWLVRVSDVKASMTMSQAFKDVWLPRDVDMFFGAMLAVGAFDVRYHIDYRDYKQADTSSRIKRIGGR
jgi:hypothetical protein